MNNKQSQKPKIIRCCTVPQSLGFVRGMLPELKNRYQVVLLSSPGSEWQQYSIDYPDIPQIQIPMQRHISPLSDLKSLWKIYRAFRKERPQMVHSMTPKAGLLCMTAAWLARVPIRIHTFTGLVFPTSTGLKRKILMATDRLTCAFATHIIPEGEGVKTDLQTHRITKKPIQVLGYGNCKGIDLDRFDRTPEVSEKAVRLRTPGAVTFIAIGRLVGDKGINELVEAFVRINAENKSTRLILVGPYERKLDPLKRGTLETIDRHNAIAAVGSQSDVRPWLAASDVAILASYREGFPNVVIEAGAMGLPQIVTDINGAREIIIDGKNGLIVPTHDADALYHAMKRMLSADFRAKLSFQARQLIAERYDRRFVEQCLLNFYSRIFEKAYPPPSTECTKTSSSDCSTSA